MAQRRDVDRMVVNVRSADRSVTLSATLRGDVGVELAPGTLRRHTEESLARQVAGVARVGIAAMRQAFEQAAAEDAREAPGG